MFYLFQELLFAKSYLYIIDVMHILSVAKYLRRVSESFKYVQVKVIASKASLNYSRCLTLRAIQVCLRKYMIW